MKGTGEYMEVSMAATVLTQKKIEKTEFDRRMEEHAKWLKNHEEGMRADFSSIDLSDMDLSGMDFSYADMRGTNLMKANLTGANLSHANLWGAFLHDADLTGAMLDETCFVLANLCFSKLNECKGEETCFTFAHIWNSKVNNAALKKANFFQAQICDCDFAGSNLEEACFAGADFDNARFVNTNLRHADFNFACRTHWSNFENSDMTGLSTADVDFGPDNLNGVKGLHMHMFCPEEGSFIAWKKCRDGRLVKLLIPESAERKGNSVHNCRASEAVVLDIFDKDGNPAEEAVSLRDEEFKYVKGETVVPKEPDPKHYGDAAGIYFVFSRADAEAFSYKEVRKDE